jgi:hypothetical protein
LRAEWSTDFDLVILEHLGATHVWYYYSCGDYEGGGSLVMYSPEKGWNIMGLEHCSCMGPLDGLPSDDSWLPTFEQQVARCHDWGEDFERLVAVVQGSMP